MKMAAGKKFTSKELRKRLKDAGDDYIKLIFLLGACMEDDKELKDLPKTIDEAKLVIQRILDGKETAIKDGLDDLETTLHLLRVTLVEGWRLVHGTDTLYSRSIDMLQSSQLSKFLKCLLDINIPDCHDILPKRSEILKQFEVRIMVVGETCAGKSSMMNVLMAGNYLPVDHGHCTRVTCELKDSIYRRATIFYLERFKRNPTKLELTNDAETEEWQRVQECIESGYDSKAEKEGDERIHVEKVVIDWPILFKKAVPNNNDEASCENEREETVQAVPNRDDEARSKNEEEENSEKFPGIKATFVDSPGFGADQETFSILKKRAKSCDACIFVINNGSHHGIEADRVQKMMAILQKNAKFDDAIINPSSAIFICNKWDTVPSNRRESFKREILLRLKDIWPGITEGLLFPFSATQVLKEIINGDISKEYCDFMSHMCNIAKRAVHLRLENYCLYLLRFLERASALVKNCKRLKADAQKQKAMLLDRVQHFRSILSELHERSTNATEIFKTNGLDKLRDSIKSCLKANQKEICKWSIAEIPSKENKSWALYTDVLQAAIKQRIKKTILNDSGVTDVVNSYQNEMKQIIEELNKNKNKVPIFGPMPPIEVIPVDDSTDGTSTQLINLFLRPVLSIMYRCVPLSVLSNKMHLKDIATCLHITERSFDEDPLNCMKLMTNILTESGLTSVAMDISLQIQSNGIKLTENIQKRLETLDVFSAAFSSDLMNCFTSSSFEKIANDCRNYFCVSVMNHEIDRSSLKLEQDIILGCGGYGYVWKGWLNEESGWIPIAAKRIVVADISENMNIFRECLLMRQLMSMANTQENDEFPPLVRYYGSMYSKRNDTYELIMVMELCDSDLHKQIKESFIIHLDSSKKVQFPGQASRGKHSTPSQESVKYAIDIALQAAKGLRFIHKNGIVHRDVKPSNILVNFRNNQIFVKITDVGVSKEENAITTCGRNVGTLLYHAPEIRLSHLTYHSPACDVYSFGLVLWEVWYGKSCFFDIPTNQLDKHIMLQTPVFTDVNPPKTLKGLIKLCWNNMPDRRPNMIAVVQELTEIAAQHSSKLN